MISWSPWGGEDSSHQISENKCQKIKLICGKNCENIKKIINVHSLWQKRYEKERWKLANRILLTYVMQLECLRSKACLYRCKLNWNALKYRGIINWDQDCESKKRNRNKNFKPAFKIGKTRNKISPGNQKENRNYRTKG